VEKRCVQQSQSRDTVHDVNGRAGRYATEVARHTIARRVATAVVGRRRRRSDLGWGGPRARRGKRRPEKKARCRGHVVCCGSRCGIRISVLF